MTDLLTRRLALFASPENRALLGRGLRGVERETLRVTPDGQLATTPHPAVLGSALTNEQITTDYSEALLEFITPATHDIADALRRLDEIHRFVHANLVGGCCGTTPAHIKAIADAVRDITPRTLPGDKREAA